MQIHEFKVQQAHMEAKHALIFLGCRAGPKMPAGGMQLSAQPDTI